MKNRNFFYSVLFLVFTISYFPEALFIKGIFSYRDLGRYFYPLRLYTVDSLKNGTIPLWNPYISCGVPHLALQQSTIFYPLSIIYYIIPFDLAFNVFLITHIFLAGLFVYILCRDWGMRDSSSVLAGVIFMFSGYMVSVLNLVTTLSSVIWLPLILLYFRRGLASGRLKYLFGAGLFLGIMFLGGEPSIFYSTLWILVFFTFFFWRGNREVSGSRIAISLPLVAASGALLSAVQLVPFLELTKLADRTRNAVSFEYLTIWSLHIRDIPSLIIPFLGRMDFSKASYWHEQSWVYIIYLGVFPLVLAALSFFLRKDWKVKFLYFTGLAFLLVSLGSHTPFYHLIHKFIPGFGFVRYPVRFLYATTFAIAILCGLGFDVYIKAKLENDRRLDVFFKWLLFAAAICALIFLGLTLYYNELIAAFRSFCVKHLDPHKDTGVLFSLIASLVNLRRLAAFLSAGVLVLFLGLRGKARAGTLGFVFISLVLIDLFSASPGKQVMIDPITLHSSTPAIEFLKNDNSFFRFMVSPKTSESDSYLEGETYEEAIRMAKDRLAANWPVVYGLYDAHGYDSMGLASYYKIMTLIKTSTSPSDTRLLDMLNVKYIVSIDEINASGYKEVFKSSARLYRGENFLPRAYLVGKYRLVKGEDKMAEALKSKEFDPRKEVLLEEDPGIKSTVDGRRSTVPEEKVEIVKYEPNEVVIDAIADSPKWLVLSDSYYPGWKAYLDGAPAKIYKANFVSRAVFLEEGKHRVRFIFDPFSFKLGLALTLAALFLILLFISKYDDILIKNARRKGAAY